MAAAKKVAEVIDSNFETKPTMAYTKEDKAIIKQLTEGEVVLTGEETSEELKTMLDSFVLEGGDAPTEQEVVDGVPNKLPIRTEDLLINGKVHKLPIYFVAALQGGKQAMYAPTGQRASHAYSVGDPVDLNDPSSEKGTAYINKAAAKFNAMRRRNVIPGETTIG